MHRFTRRNFLRTLALSGATAWTASRLGLLTNRSLATSPLIRSQDGALEFALTAEPGRLPLAERSATLYGYNGAVPGPRLELRPGDQVRIRFSNRLPEPTNLHFHGLHVSPGGKADDVFLEIPPGENHTYEFSLPPTHRGGTFWYHPHVHHLIARQLWAGLAGLLIVRGPLEEVPELQETHEAILMLKDFSLDAAGNLLTPDPSPRIMQGREGDLVLVNGELNPTLALPQEGLLRLRFLNASVARFYRLQLEDHPMYLIATDGGPIGEPFELRELLLSPGERAEVLVRGERPPGRYRLLNLPYQRYRMGMTGRRGAQPLGSEAAAALATVHYQPKDRPLPLPARLVPVEPLPEANGARRLTFSHGMMPGKGMVFTIDGRTFDPDRTDALVKLGTVEEWEVVNGGGMMMMGFDHPFHIHTNAFQVVSQNGKRPPFAAWKDTVNVPMGETVRVRIPFEDFAGRTVYHCHILDHEDLGMMAVIEMRA